MWWWEDTQQNCSFSAYEVYYLVRTGMFPQNYSKRNFTGYSQRSITYQCMEWNEPVSKPKKLLGLVKFLFQL
jgi:hypothetical protein